MSGCCDGRGFGVRTLSPIPKDTFVTEYVGEIISHAENIAREVKKSGAEFYTWELNNGYVMLKVGTSLSLKNKNF